MTCLRRALAEPCPREERAELLVELGAAERLVDGQAAIAHLREGLGQVTGDVRHAEIASQLAWALSYSGRAGEAVATAEQALLRLAGDERDLRRRLEATILMAATQDPSVRRARARFVGQFTSDCQPNPGIVQSSGPAAFVPAFSTVNLVFPQPFLVPPPPNPPGTASCLVSSSFPSVSTSIVGYRL